MNLIEAVALQPSIHETVAKELVALIERCGALVIPPHLPARVWDSDRDGWGMTPWLYPVGKSRQMQIQVRGPAVVRVELCADPTWLDGFPMYAPITADEAFEQPAGWPFVRFSAEQTGDDASVRIAAVCS